MLVTVVCQMAVGARRAASQLPLPPGTPLLGQAAQDSAPARAFAALLAAVAKGDLDVIRAKLARGHPGLSMLTPSGLPAIRDELLPDGASPTVVMGTLEEVYVENGLATLVFGRAPARTIWKMKLEAGGWKLTT